MVFRKYNFRFKNHGLNLEKFYLILRYLFLRFWYKSSLVKIHPKTMLNNNFLPERTAPTRKQRDTQLNYPPLTNLINLLTANRKTSSFIYQDIRASLSLSLINPILSNIFFTINHPPRPCSHIQNLLQNLAPKRQLFSRDPIIQSTIVPFWKTLWKKTAAIPRRGWEDGGFRTEEFRQIFLTRIGRSPPRADYENRGRRGRVETRP